ncbi:unnamed protein product [Ilex paraguariensis]|uniref:Uncharacterized protein n=1 Tax=Ilex paraguariensis TaxID=185542 RepID=A0ABC8QRJ8_9AQUA
MGTHKTACLPSDLSQSPNPPTSPNLAPLPSLTPQRNQSRTKPKTTNQSLCADRMLHLPFQCPIRRLWLYRDNVISRRSSTKQWGSWMKAWRSPEAEMSTTSPDPRETCFGARAVLPRGDFLSESQRTST